MTEHAELQAMEYVLRVKCGACGHVQDANMRTTSLVEALAWQKQFELAQAAQKRGDNGSTS